MFYRVIKDTFLESTLREAYRKDLQREIAFREWLCNNLPPFSAVRTDCCFNQLFPSVTSFKLEGNSVNWDDWGEDEYHKGYYYINLDTENGWQLYQRAEKAAGEYLYIDQFIQTLGLELLDNYSVPPQFFESNNVMYIWVDYDIETAFLDLWSKQIIRAGAAEYIQRAITSTNQLLSSNIQKQTT